MKIKKYLGITCLVLLFVVVGYFANFGAKDAISPQSVSAAVMPEPAGNIGDHRAQQTTPVTGTASSLPTDTLRLWLAADVGVSKDGDNHVSAWTDQSGHHMDAMQASTDAQPLFVNVAQSGKPAIRFDGKASYLSLPTGKGDFSHGLSIFAVVTPTGNSAYGRVMELFGEGRQGGFGIMRKDTSSAWEYYVDENSWNSMESDQYTGMTLDHTQLLEVVETPDGGTSMSISTSRAINATLPMPSKNTYSQNFLGASPANKQYWTGDISEILLYSTGLTDRDRQRVEQYLMKKYAIQPVVGYTEPYPVVKTAQSSPVQYLLSLPHGWTPDRQWPILVTIDGVEHDFRWNSMVFAEARKERPYIIVTPCVTSNGNDPHDKEAIITIAREVQQQYHGQDKFFITGFSAGGHVTWQVIFEHPELFAGAVLASGNCIGRGVTTISQAPERIQLPIHGVYGEKDYPGYFDKQWPYGKQLARDHGYQNISEEVVPGGGHWFYPDQVLAFCDTVRAQNK